MSERNRFRNTKWNAPTTAYAPANFQIVGQSTQISVPVIVSRMCSAPSAVRPAIRITAADATTNVIPMIASCGTADFSMRVNEKIRAPSSVKPSAERSCPSPFSIPIRIATVVPNAAICANARSTKITPRAITCRPRYAWIERITSPTTIGGMIRSNIRSLANRSVIRECSGQPPDPGVYE